MLSFLLSLDIALFKAINGFNFLVMDELMHFVSLRSAWIPSYVLVLYLIWEKEGRDWKRTLGWALTLVVTILIADQIASSLLKPWVARLRPCYADLPFNVHVYDGHCGGKYGFVSSHAANFFGMATVLSTYFQQRRATWICFGCAVLVAYSRVYLGVHYPSDVIGGALVGWMAGHIALWLRQTALARISA